MTTDAIETRTDTATSTTVDHVRGEGISFLVAAVAFFVGSGVLTRSGQPGASTPVPWLVSHAVWVLATAFVALGTLRLRSSDSGSATGTAGSLAAGLFGLGVVHALQWTSWVYADVFAYQQGSHGLLSAPLLHPVGTGHMLAFAVLLGGGVASLAWTVAGAGITHRALPWLGVAIGTVTALAGTVALLTVADVRTPVSLAAILSQAASFAWIGLLGIAMLRGRFTAEPMAEP